MKTAIQNLLVITICALLYSCASAPPCMEQQVGVQIDLRGEPHECFYEVTKRSDESEQKKIAYLCISESEPQLVLELENSKDGESLMQAWRRVVDKESLILPTGGVDKSGKVWHGGQIVEKSDKNYFSVAASTLEDILTASNAGIDIDPIFTIDKDCKTE